MAQSTGVWDLDSRTGERFVLYRAAPLSAFVLEATCHKNPPQVVSEAGWNLIERDSIGGKVVRI